MSRPPTFLVFYELLILSLLSLLTGHGANRRNLIRLSVARYLLALLLPKMHNRCCCFNDIGRYFSKPGMKLITFPLYLHGPTCIYSKHKRSWKCILDQHHNFISLQNLEIWNIYSLFTFFSCLGDEETCVKHELRALDFQDCNHKLYVLSVCSKMKIIWYNLTNFCSDFGIRKLLVKLNWFDYFAYELSPLPFGEFYEGEKHWRFGEYNFILALIIMLLLIVDFQTTLYLENQFWWSDLWWILILQAQVQQFAPWIL